MHSPIDVMNRFIDEFQSAADESVARQLLAADFVDHTPFPGFGATRQDVIHLFRMIRSSFPDLRAEVHHQISYDDRVATSKSFFGTHLGPFAGIEPTHRKVEIRVMDIVRITNGQIREHWNVVDIPGLMSQLEPS